MTPAEQLDHLSHLCGLAATRLDDWRKEQALTVPDGYLTSTRSDSQPRGKGGISDRTGTAATTRSDHADTAATIGAITGNIVTLAVALVAVAVRHDPISGGWSVDPIERLQVARVALRDASGSYGALRGAYVDVRGAQVAESDARDSIRAGLDDLRAIIGGMVHDAGFAKDELCHGNRGTDYACEHDHDRQPVPAVKDGLCTAGYHRRYRAERKGEAA